MKTKLLLLMISIILSISGCYKQEILNIQNDIIELDPLQNKYLVNNALYSTVALTMNDDSDGTQLHYCTGIFVSPTIIITARHCVVDDHFYAFENMVFDDEHGPPPEFKMEIILNTLNTDVSITTYEAMRKVIVNNEQAAMTISAKIIFLTGEHFGDEVDPDDIAILKVEQRNASKNWVDISTSDVVIGDRVYSIGMPNATPWILADGVVSHEIFVKGKETHNLVNILVAHGSSGGPLLNYRGELVGLAQSMLATSEESQSNLGVFIVPKKLEQYLNIAR